MREKSNFGFFAAKAGNSSLNEYVREVEELSYKVANLQAVRPSKAGVEAMGSLAECVKEMKAIAQPRVAQVNLSNLTAVREQTVVEDKTPPKMSMTG